MEELNLKTISCQEMKEMDSHAINKIGIPGIVLMENAALRYCLERINYGINRRSTTYIG